MQYPIYRFICFRVYKSEVSQQLNQLSSLFFDSNNLVCEKNCENSGFIVSDLVVAAQNLVNNTNILIKVTHINYVSRNQLHNTANGYQILNFGLIWPDKRKVYKRQNIASHCNCLYSAQILHCHSPVLVLSTQSKT